MVDGTGLENQRGATHRGFESRPLRHVMLTRTLGSNSAAEGLFMFVARQGDDGGDGGD